MSAIIIDGVAMAKQVLAEQKTRADRLAQQGRPPGLAVVLVGDDQASAVYVRSKERACRDAGRRSRRQGLLRWEERVQGQGWL